MTVAMELATALHHSAQRPKAHGGGVEKEVQEMCAATGGLSAPPAGGRPGILTEPRPQRSDRTERRSSVAGVPLLGPPALAAKEDDMLNSTALAFLVNRALMQKGEQVAR